MLGAAVKAVWCKANNLQVWIVTFLCLCMKLDKAAAWCRSYTFSIFSCSIYLDKCCELISHSSNCKSPQQMLGATVKAVWWKANNLQVCAYVLFLAAPVTVFCSAAARFVCRVLWPGEPCMVSAVPSSSLMRLPAHITDCWCCR
jgi:hypothetical protein